MLRFFVFFDFYHLETVGDSLINMVVKTTLGIENPGWSSGQITQASQPFLKNIDSSEKGSILCQIAGAVGLKEYFGYHAFYKGGKGLAYTHAYPGTGAPRPLAIIVEKLNNRLRKSLIYAAPNEIFQLNTT